MESNKKQPEVRFTGFCDSWANESLKNLAEINPKTILPDEFKYVDLESVVGIKLSNYRIEKKATAPSRAQRLAKKGDIFFQTVRPYQRNNYLFNLSDNDYVFSTGYAQIRPYLDSYFLFSKLQDDKFVSDVIDQCTGTSYPAINSNALSRIEIYFPNNKEEQKRIGALLENLDIRISCQQQELDTLKQTKQGFLQKMFPKEGESVPKVRFKGFIEDWIELKLGETKTFFTDGNYGEAYPSKEDMRNSFDGIPFLRGSDIKNGFLNAINSNYISKEKHKELTSGHIEFDDIVIAVRGSIGTLGYAKEDNIGWNINSQLAIIRTDKSELIGRFLIQFLLGNRGQKELLSRNTGTALKQLPIKQLKDVPVFVPSINEQRQISDFFKQLDEVIALHQQELDALKQTKKAFLQKMFV